MSKYVTLVDCKQCYICKIKYNIKENISCRSLIEIHHIVEKENNGDNSEYNLLPLCSNCHSMVHEGVIKLDKWFYSTRGWVFHFWNKDGKEFWGN